MTYLSTDFSVHSHLHHNPLHTKRLHGCGPRPWRSPAALLLFAFVASLALVVSGCGDDDGGNGQTDAEVDAQTLTDAGPDGDVDAQTLTDAGPDAEVDAAQLCGNGLIDGEEVCDDGNNESGDGCNSTCTQEDDEDIRANTLYVADQRQLSTAADGDYAVTVWTDYNSPDQNGTAVVYRLFSSDGAPRVNESGYTFEKLVNSTYDADQIEPSVGVAPDGSFVVVWTDESDNANSGKNIRGRLFEADGTPKANAITGDTGDFLINSVAPGDQYEPQVAVSDLGYFLVVWTDAGGNGADGQGTSIMGRIFTDVGAPYTNPDTGDASAFTINSNYVGDQTAPAVASQVGPSNSYAVAWTDGSGWADASSTGITGTVLQQDGANIAGGDLAINTTTNGEQSQPALASQRASGFVAVWTDGSGVGDTSFSGIRARIFDGTGVPRTNGVNSDENDFSINTLTTGRQQSPSVAVQPVSVAFTVVWQDGSGTDGSFAGIRGRFCYANGSPYPNPLSGDNEDSQINTTTTNSQLAPVVSLSGPVALYFWEDDSRTAPDSDSFSVRFRVVAHGL